MDEELHPHGDLALDGLADPGQVRPAGADRHAVHHPDDAVLGLELGLEDEGVSAVAAPGLADAALGMEEPAAVVGGPEQRGEAGARVERGKQSQVLSGSA